jgi:hypothetical protein
MLVTWSVWQTGWIMGYVGEMAGDALAAVDWLT